jgi:hypothetical protein
VLGVPAVHERKGCSEMSIRHIRISVRGALSRTPRQLQQNWSGAITDDAGKVLQSGAEIQSFFMDQLALGREFIPMGQCDGFDFKTGCPGHETKNGEA